MKKIILPALVAFFCLLPFAQSQDSYIVVDTGQTTCYDNSKEISCPQPGEPFYGQDAQYAGTPFAFQDNGNGTVTDLNTGLMWQQVPDSMKLNWQGALQYAENFTLAGYTDWRLPTVKELYSLIDYGRGWPYIDTAYFVCELDPQETKNTQYWSSTKYFGLTHGGQETAFGVNFATGHNKGYPTGMPAYVRCVRGLTYGENNFVDNGDGTVTDLATGLMWQKSDDSIARDWEDALAYSEDLELAGYTNWRLPNAKELQSIVDYSGSYPAIDPRYFVTSNTAKDGWFWTSTSAYHSPNSPQRYYAWYVAFGYATDANGVDLHGAGAVRFAPKAEGNPTAEGDEIRYYNCVRCVRDVSDTSTSSFGILSSLFDTSTVFVAGDQAYCTDVLGSSKIAFGLAVGGVSENPEGRTDVILTTIEHDTGNLIPVGGPAVNSVANEFDQYFGITFNYDPGGTPPVFEISAEGVTITLNLNDHQSEDICIVYLAEHNGRSVMLVWGYGWRGTYAGSVLMGDTNTWAAYPDAHMFMLRWIDSNGDLLVQISEITVEFVH